MTSEQAALNAWRDVCARLAKLGEEVLAPPYPDSSDDRVDALEHLAEQAMCWIGWSVFHADPRRPFFQRQNDLITQWGGPNADNVYRHARVDAGRRYRIRGRMNSCEDLMLAIRAGLHAPADVGHACTRCTPTSSASARATSSSCWSAATRCPDQLGAAARRARRWCRSASTTSTGGRRSPARHDHRVPRRRCRHAGGRLDAATLAAPSRRGDRRRRALGRVLEHLPPRSPGAGHRQRVRRRRTSVDQGPGARRATRSASGTSPTTRRSSSSPTCPTPRYWGFQLLRAGHLRARRHDRAPVLAEPHARCASTPTAGPRRARRIATPASPTGSTPAAAAPVCSRSGGSGRTYDPTPTTRARAGRRAARRCCPTDRAGRRPTRACRGARRPPRRTSRSRYRDVTGGRRAARRGSTRSTAARSGPWPTPPRRRSPLDRLAGEAAARLGVTGRGHRPARRPTPSKRSGCSCRRWRTKPA